MANCCDDKGCEIAALRANHARNPYGHCAHHPRGAP